MGTSAFISSCYTTFVFSVSVQGEVATNPVTNSETLNEVRTGVLNLRPCSLLPDVTKVLLKTVAGSYHLRGCKFRQFFFKFISQGVALKRQKETEQCRRLELHLGSILPPIALKKGGWDGTWIFAGPIFTLPNKYEVISNGECNGNMKYSEGIPNILKVNAKVRYDHLQWEAAKRFLLTISASRASVVRMRVTKTVILVLLSDALYRSENTS